MAQATIAAAVRCWKRESALRYAWTYVITPVVLLKQLPRVHLFSSRSSHASAPLALDLMGERSLACTLLALHIRGVQVAGAAVDHRCSGAAQRRRR